MCKNNETTACDISKMGLIYNILWEHRKKEIIQLQRARQGFKAELTIMIAIVY